VLTLPDGRKAGIKRLFKEHCAVTATFLEAHYCAHDWRFAPPVARWLDSYLRDMDVVALGLFVGDSELVGTIFATPLSKGSVVMSHGGGTSELSRLSEIGQRYPSIEVSVAGGVTDLDGVRRLRDAGVSALILGEALLSGAIDFEEAQAIANQAG
jgi:hypothetical protein